MDTPEATISWLLEGDPAIRWQAKRDLLDLPAEDYRQDRQAVASSGWGKRLLDLQDSTGIWSEGLYGPKWTSTTYTLLLLYRLGLEPTSPAARAGVARLWEGTKFYDGGLTPAKTVPGPEACVTGMYTMLARYFGYEHRRVDEAEEWLLSNQYPDGGWNCRLKDRHSSFHTSITVMEALAEVSRTTPNRIDIQKALDGGREFFLNHRLYKSHRDGSVVDKRFTLLSFPPRWRYDILRGLDHFQAVGAAPDRRLSDALELLKGRQRRDGSWPVQNKHAGRVWFDMEPIGKPSRWNTLRAMRVLRWAY